MEEDPWRLTGGAVKRNTPEEPPRTAEYKKMDKDGCE